MADFKDRLKELIGENSANSFARKTDIGESLLRKYLSGTLPSIENAQKIASGAGVSFLWLAVGEGPKWSLSDEKFRLRPDPEIARGVREIVDKIESFLKDGLNPPLPEDQIQQYLAGTATNSDLPDDLRGRADLFLRLVYKDADADIRTQERVRRFQRQREAARLKIQDIAIKEKIELPPTAMPHLELVVDRYNMAEEDIRLLVIGFQIAILEAQGKLNLTEPDAD